MCRWDHLGKFPGGSRRAGPLAHSLKYSETRGLGEGRGQQGVSDPCTLSLLSSTSSNEIGSSPSFLDHHETLVFQRMSVQPPEGSGQLILAPTCQDSFLALVLAEAGLWQPGGGRG